MTALGEVWRLHKSNVVAVCRVTWTSSGYAVSVARNGVIVTTTIYPDFSTASENADAVRRAYLSEGWTGLGPR